MSNATHIHEVGGKPYRQDTRGALVPESAIKPMDLLQDEQVRKMVGFARDLSGQIARFKGHTYDDIGSLQALIAQEYGAKIGGQKGNITLTSFDGLLKCKFRCRTRSTSAPSCKRRRSWSTNACANGPPTRATKSARW